MVTLRDLQKIDEFEWEIPKTYRRDMKVPVRIFATRQQLEEIESDKSFDQAVNSATLPGLVGSVFIMPDMHQGYGFPIGAVAATRFPDGVISPGGIGYDINCGVRLLASHIHLEEVENELSDLATCLNQYCPSGVGIKGEIELSERELEKVCSNGSVWALRKGFATEADIRRTEEEGRLDGADPGKLSQKAKERGKLQLGTLGSGNHFLEVDVIDQVFDVDASRVMGLSQGMLVVQIHCGSRGLGHQVCSDYVAEFQKLIQLGGQSLADRELVFAPLQSSEGKNYISAMRCAANYAFANRQLLAYQARAAFEKVFANKRVNWNLDQVYDIAHNMGKIEQHQIEGKKVTVCVHRKGATRAFGPLSLDIPEEYRMIGQPVFVPGSMGTESWVLVGTGESMEHSLGSSCHGAGRLMSRQEAKKKIRGDRLRGRLEEEGIKIQAGSLSGLAEEAPEAYKDVSAVVETMTKVGIVRKVARLKPLIVIKG